MAENSFQTWNIYAAGIYIYSISFHIWVSVDKLINQKYVWIKYVLYLTYFRISTTISGNKFLLFSIFFLLPWV